MEVVAHAGITAFRSKDSQVVIQDLVQLSAHAESCQEYHKKTRYPRLALALLHPFRRDGPLALQHPP